MKLRKITIPAMACAAWICGASANAAPAGGVVIYKDFSFDPDSQAEIADYTSFDRYSSVDNVLMPNGQTLRITPDQEPIYIPRAGGAQSNGAAMIRTIVAAERRFPQFAPKLEAYRVGWSAVPKPAPQPSPAAAAAPEATAQTAALEAATPDGGSTRVLNTKSGETLTDWKISAREGDTLVITHADGISRVPISDLPDNLFGFPPEIVARAEQLRQQPTPAGRPTSSSGRTGQALPPRLPGNRTHEPHST